MTGAIGAGHREPSRSNATVPRGSRDREIEKEGDLKGLHLSTGSRVRGQKTQPKDKKKNRKQKKKENKRGQEGRRKMGGGRKETRIATFMYPPRAPLPYVLGHQRTHYTTPDTATRGDGTQADQKANGPPPGAHPWRFRAQTGQSLTTWNKHGASPDPSRDSPR